jgi:anaerobic sulfite reductase subunit B
MATLMPADVGQRERTTGEVDPMLPVPFCLAARIQNTPDTATLLLEPIDGGVVGFRPGQFSMLYAFGVGEVPISISGATEGRLSYTIRSVGGVTRALVGATEGQVLGVRGPFGIGWDLATAEGGDLVVIAGGIGLAPLRSAILQLIANRKNFGRVCLVYGARTPAEVLYPVELLGWEQAGIEVIVTVDRADQTWSGRVGLVTKPLASLSLDPIRTTALVCGPEVMMRHVADTLTDLGIPAPHIQLSLERTMRCGVGLCGHCQLRELLICVDGPVVGLDVAGGLLKVREL